MTKSYRNVSHLYALTISWVIVMIGSLKWRLVDVLVPGTWHGRIGLDFFCIPRGFINLLHNKSVFHTDFSSYGPYATWYTYHPVLPVVLGSWLSIFKPWVAYGIFVGLSIFALWWCGKLLGRYTKDKFLKALIFGLLFCSPATYLMIWNAQIHIVTLLGVVLVLGSLLDMLTVEKEEKSIHVKINKMLMVGLIMSMFSKPIVLLMAPVLLITRETRLTTLVSLGIYAVVSGLFWVIPILNPESVPIPMWFDDKILSGSDFQPFLVHDNLIHWANMVYQSQVITTAEEGYYYELFSLPTYAQMLFKIKLSPIWFKIPLLMVLLLSGGSFWIKSRSRQVVYALVVVCLSISSHFLSYNLVWEYQYTILIIILPVILITRKWLNLSQRDLVILIIAFGMLYIPVGPILWSDRTNFWLLLIARSMRVVPAVGIFVLLTKAAVLQLKEVSKN